MVKVSIHSITAPGAGVVNLSKEDPSSQSLPEPMKPQRLDAPPLIELPTALPPTLSLSPEQANSLTKTEGSQITPANRMASASVSSAGVGMTPPADSEALPSSAKDKYAKKTQEGSRGMNSLPGKSVLEASKTAAFARAEVLASLPAGLSKKAAERLSQVLLKLAFVGTGNAPQAGQVAVPREAVAARQATTSGVKTTGNVGTRLPDGAAQMALRKPTMATPSLDKLLSNSLRPEAKAAALVTLAREGLQKHAVLDFIRVSQDKKAALSTLGRMYKTAESLHTRELMQQDGKGTMPSGPRGPVPDVLTPQDRETATDWFQRLDPISQSVPRARVIGRMKGSANVQSS